MGKRLFCLLLALILVLLCGCNGNETETTGNIQKATKDMLTESTVGEPTGSETADTEPIGSRQIPAIEDVAYQVPSYEGDLLIPYDPERHVYIPFYNSDIDFYPDYYFAGISGYVITKEHYEIDEIQVKVPAYTEYEIIIHEVQMPASVINSGENWNSPEKLQDYHYLSQQGINWQEYAQLAVTAEAASLIISEYYPEMLNEGIYDEYYAVCQSYNQVRDKYLAQYETVTHGNQPFTVYSISFRFTGIGTFEETVETVEFTFGEESYTVDIGQWRFHKERPAELTVSPDRVGVEQSKIMIGAITDSPYNGGYVLLQDALSFVATRDLTITGVRQYGVQVNMLGARVKIYGSESVDFYWDMQQPLDVKAGDSVKITLYIKDDRFAEYEGGVSTTFLMDYEVRGKAYTMNLPCLLSRINYYAWDAYLMGFEGYDIGEYYTCYYVPMFDGWIRELPEKWLK